MTITAQVVFRYFLSFFEKIMNENKEAHISPFFKNFFTKQELIDILEFNSSDNDDRINDLNNKDCNELFQMIKSEVYILRYYLNQWEQELSTHDHINPRGVYNTLEQLGHLTHYLNQKSIIDWDEYDISNYMALQRKAGKIAKVYGIYDVSISQNNVYEADSQPKRFFENEDEAQEIMNSYISNETFEKDTVHILERYVAV